MGSLFSFQKKKRLAGKLPLSKREKSLWKHRFVCLAYCDQSRIPMSDFEKDQLLEAGLGEKEIEFFSLDMEFDEVREVLLEEFPRLKDGGGFLLMKGVPNSRSLEPLPKAVYLNLKALKQRVGQARTYIRPIQRDLDLSPVFRAPERVSFWMCRIIRWTCQLSCVYTFHLYISCSHSTAADVFV